jgi:hypothetical protein
MAGYTVYGLPRRALPLRYLASVEDGLHRVVDLNRITEILCSLLGLLVQVMGQQNKQERSDRSQE